MDIKLFPRFNWEVKSSLSKETIIQEVQNTTVKKTWNFSLKNALTSFTFTSKIFPDAFWITIGSYGMTYAKSPLRPPLKVSLKQVSEGGLTVLDCRLGLSDVALLFFALFYSFFVLVSYYLGVKSNDWWGVLIPLMIALFHYGMVLYNFNRQLLIYRKYIEELAQERKG